MRTTRKLTLTEVGRAYYQRCSEILSNISDAEEAVIDLQEKPRGTLRISAAGVFGEDFIVPACADFMQLYPDLRVDIKFSNRAIDLIAEGFDLAIRAGVLKDSALIARHVMTRKLLIVGSPEYLRKMGKPTSISAIDNHNCLVGSHPTWRFKEDHRHVDIRVNGNWQSDNGKALATAAVRGLGLAQLSDFMSTIILNREPYKRF